MVKIINNNIYITRGDTAKINFFIKDETGEEYDYSADTAIFTVRHRMNSSFPVIQKTVTNGKIELTNADTQQLPFGEYVFDVELRKANGDICTVIVPHNFTVGGEVTY